MGRIFCIVALVALFLTTDIAGAGSGDAMRLPIQIQDHQSNGQSVVVEPGDHLWKISARHLADSGDAVAPYWRRVIDVNMPSLRSGDPDLIFPGEVIDLPAS